MRIYELAIIWGAIGAGSAILLWIGRTFLHWKQIGSWPRVPVTVESAAIRWKWLHTWPARLKNYHPDICYIYEFGGVRYTGTVATVRDACIASVEDEKVRAYVEVLRRDPIAFVNPSLPSEAYLTADITRQHWKFLLTYSLVGILLVASGTALLVFR